MKKVLFSLLMVLSIFIVGCDKENTTIPTNQEEQEEQEEKIMVGEFDLTLTEKSSFKELHYKYPKKTNINSLGTMTLLTYTKDATTDRLLFKIGLGKIEGKTVSEGMTGKSFQRLEDKKIGNLTWEVYLTEDKYHSYGYNYHNDSFMVSFISDDDIEQFEEEFIKNIYFQ